MLFANGFINFQNYFTKDKIQFIVSYENEKGEIYYYRSRWMDNLYKDLNGWKRFEYALKIEKPKSANDIIKIYFWNSEKKTYWIDDLKISFIDQD